MILTIFEAYMSPESVTEIIHFFIGTYRDHLKTGPGGGLQSEQENIAVVEIEFDKACKMIHNGEIKDGRTIFLLQYLMLNKR